jgi:hypothetical protein
MFEIIDEIRPRVKERASIRERVFTWLGAICFLSLLLIATVCPIYALAASIAVTTQGDAKITLFDEPCKLRAVSNLKMRAVWVEKGKTFEGCFGVHPGGVVLAYFDDGSVVIMPVQDFAAVTGV